MSRTRPTGRGGRRVSLRHRRRKLEAGFELQLTSLLDVVVILVVFLLKSMSATQTTLPPTPGLQMPVSKATEVPEDSPILVVSTQGMTFEGQPVLDFQVSAEGADAALEFRLKEGDLDEGGRRIIPLFSALTVAREQSELLRAKSSARDAQGNPLPFDGVLAIQADKKINYDIIRRVMYTAGTAGFKVFRFLAEKKEE